ncbi:unnamed protein product, partial [Trichobilharzia regenti]
TKFTKSSQHFQVNQRLEAVDKRCPSLIRVANVVDNMPPGFLTLGYDGWSDKYNIRVEVGSLDLFPVGYCHASGHPLQVPPGCKLFLLLLLFLCTIINHFRIVTIFLIV